ncbi:MAG: hypothetical protein U0T83_02190 [Bacteriovoracaceae bacterium]
MKKLILFSIILLLSTQLLAQNNPHQELDYFYYKIYKEFITSYEVEPLNGAIELNKKIALDGPKSTFLPVLRIKNYEKNFCLIFQKETVLKVVEIEHFESCDGSFLKNYVAQISNIHQVFIELKDFELILKINVGDINREMNFKFYNIKKSKSEFKRFDKLEKRGILPAIYIAGLPNKKGLVDGTICQDFNQKCEESISYICDQCLNGWYEISGGKCHKKHIKICGINQCGQKDQFACPKGLDNNSDDLCSEPKKFGFCEENLKVECSENKYLKCQ